MLSLCFSLYYEHCLLIFMSQKDFAIVPLCVSIANLLCQVVSLSTVCRLLNTYKQRTQMNSHPVPEEIDRALLYHRQFVIITERLSY